VGGLWGVVNEKVSTAARSRAGALAMIDLALPMDELWQHFRNRMTLLGVTCECISSDICAFAAGAPGRKFDVVHCSGVLYHHPSPLSLLEALRTITGRYLVLTSAVTPEIIENNLGTLQVGPSGIIFVPTLDQLGRKILAEHWLNMARIDLSDSISEAERWHSTDFARWWCLPTPRAMLAMARCAGFRVMDFGPMWHENALSTLLEVAF
jgi:hypothetical protein